VSEYVCQCPTCGTGYSDTTLDTRTCCMALAAHDALVKATPQPAAERK
jgi:hypothetical protein